MRTLLIAASLVGGVFSQNENVQDFAAKEYNGMRDRIQERWEDRSMTTEEQELRDLLKDLMEEYDFRNLDAEGKITAMEEIVAELTLKAEELGVDIAPFIEKYEDRVARYEQYNSEEWQLFRAYMEELKAEYDFDNLTAEEKIALMDEMHELMVLKAEELGIDITDILERHEERAEHWELMNSEEMLAFKAYAEELKASYDFDNLTREEKIDALAEMKDLLEAKAEELGIDLDELPRPELNGRQKAFRRGFRAGREYERRQGPGAPGEELPPVEGEEA